ELGVAGDEDLEVDVLADAAANVDRLSGLVLDLDRGGEFALALALEEEDLAGPGAGDQVGDAVAVEVHQLGTEADASARGNAAVLSPVLELDSGGELRRGVRAGVLEDPEDPAAELADEQVAGTVPVDIADERGGVAD